MKLTKLNYKGFEEYIVQVAELSFRLEYRFLFDNGFGASVIKGKTIIGGSCGAEDDLFELTLLDNDSVIIKRPVSDESLKWLCRDVAGHLDNQQVVDYLGKIRGLK